MRAWFGYAATALQSPSRIHLHGFTVIEPGWLTDLLEGILQEMEALGGLNCKAVTINKLYLIINYNYHSMASCY
jgi:hypothetical protein